MQAAGRCGHNVTRIGKPDGRAADSKAVQARPLAPSRGCQMTWGVGGPLTQQPAPWGSWGQALDLGPRARERGWGEGMGSFEDDGTHAAIIEGGCQAWKVWDPK